MVAKIIGILLLFAAVAGGAYYIGSKNSTMPGIFPSSPTPSEKLTGSDRDPHGCIGSAGYSWCQQKQKCLREWEEPCSGASPSVAADEPGNLAVIVKQALITKHGSDVSGLTVTVSSIEGSYAKGMANGQGGGGLWFAAKTGGTWNLVWDGNGIIQCSDISAFPDFPVSMIGQCWDTKSDKLVTR